MEKTPNKETEEHIRRAEEVENALHSHAIQRRTWQSQLGEIDNALTELNKTEEAYRLIGAVMVKAEPKALLAELSEKKEIINARLAAVHRQEQQLQTELNELKEKILGA